MPSQDSFVALAAALASCFLVYIIIKNFSAKQPTIDKEKYQVRWLEITNNININSHDSKQMAIMRADKMLDQALKETGSKGETMGERMKNRQKVWSNANAVWQAHKLRNQIAHEEITVNEAQVRRALSSFKQALKDLGVM